MYQFLHLIKIKDYIWLIFSPVVFLNIYGTLSSEIVDCDVVIRADLEATFIVYL